MKQAAEHLMAELEENGFSFYGPRRNLALSIMLKYLEAAQPIVVPAPQEPENAAE